MRKFVLMAIAGLALAFSAPGIASAAPAMGGNAVRLAAEGVSTTETVAWHCRPRSVWCRGGYRRYYYGGHWRWGSRRYYYGGHWRWGSRRYYRPYRYYYRPYRAYRFYY